MKSEFVTLSAAPYCCPKAVWLPNVQLFIPSAREREREREKREREPARKQTESAWGGESSSLEPGDGPALAKL